MKISKKKEKKCKICGSKFVPYSTFVKWCSPECGYKLSQINKAKEERSYIRKRKKELNENDRGWWLKKAEQWCNRYIRKRDENKDCICCPGVNKADVWNAGHYIPSGRCSALRFNELNIHKQRARPCNMDKSGNLIQYRKSLIDRIGIDKVEWLEGPQPIKRWTIDELKEVVEMYKSKLKELEK